MKTRLQPATPTTNDAPDAARSAESALKQAEDGLRAAVEGLPGHTAEPGAPPVHSDRPVGRSVIAFVLAGGLIVAAITMWTAFFRYSAHGVVVASTSEISAPWSGAIQTVHVRPGEFVEQGALLATVVDPDLDASIARLRDELKTTQAELDAETARLEESFLTQQDNYLRLTSQYLDVMGRLGAESATAEELAASRDRLEPLVGKAIVPEQEIDSLRFRHDASSARIVSLQRAAAALESRLSQTPSQDRINTQLKPWVTKTELLAAEIARLEAKQQRGAVRAPFPGRVVRVRGHAGEACSSDRPIVELLDDRSREITLYVAPSRIERFPVGRRVWAKIGSRSAAVCQVTSIGAQHEASPLADSDATRPQQVIPVYVSMPEDLPDGAAPRAGEEVRILSSWGGLR